MKDIDTQIEQRLKSLKTSVTMSTKERDSMRESLAEYMEMVPVRNTSIARTESLSASRVFIKMLSYKFVPALLMVVMLVGSGAGVAFASENALPGDRLYSMKILVEESRAKVLLTDEARVTWAEKRMQRRAQEAVVLEQLGRLTTENSVIIEKRIKRQDQKIIRILKKMEKKNPTKATRIRKYINTNKDKSLKVLTPILKTQIEKESEIEPGIRIKQIQKPLRVLQDNKTIIKKQENKDIKRIKKMEKTNKKVNRIEKKLRSNPQQQR